MDPTAPLKIVGELAGLLQLAVPPAVKLCHRKMRNGQIESIDKDLEEGTTQLMDCWSLIPEDRKADIERRFLL